MPTNGTPMRDPPKTALAPNNLHRFRMNRLFFSPGRDTFPQFALPINLGNRLRKLH